MNKLITKRNSREDALYAEKIKTKEMEDNFNKTSTELMQAKLCFVEDFLSGMKKPTTYAEAVKSNQSETPGPVTLITDLCNAVSSVPELKTRNAWSLDGSPIAQSSYNRDSKLFITLDHKKETDSAIDSHHD